MQNILVHDRPRADVGEIEWEEVDNNTTNMFTISRNVLNVQ